MDVLRFVVVAEAIRRLHIYTVQCKLHITRQIYISHIYVLLLGHKVWVFKVGGVVLHSWDGRKIKAETPPYEAIFGLFIHVLRG